MEMYFIAMPKSMQGIVRIRNGPCRKVGDCRIREISARLFVDLYVHGSLLTRKIKEEYSSAVFSNGLTSTNTLPQKTPSNGLILLFVWLSALFPLHLLY
jgi:hypothetical protein